MASWGGDVVDERFRYPGGHVETAVVALLQRLWDADPQQQVAAPAVSGLVEHVPHALDQFSHERLALTRQASIALGSRKVKTFAKDQLKPIYVELIDDFRHH